jgi:alpha-L-fucosidase 2
MVEFSRRALLGGAAGAAAVATLPAGPAWAGHDQWPRFLAAADLIWKRPPATWYEGPFLGNGFLASGIYRDQDGIRFNVQHSEVQDHRPQFGSLFGLARLPIGYLTLRPVGAITGVDWRLDVWNAELRGTITTAAGSLALRALVHTGHDLLAVEVVPSAGETGFTWTFTPQEAVSPRTDPRFNRTPPPGYVPNPAPTVSRTGGLEIVTQPLLAGGEHATVWREVRRGSARTLYASVAWSHPDSGATARAVRTVRRSAHLPADVLAIGHRAWWHRFYRKSFLSIPDAKLQSFYWLQLYKIASAARRHAPIMATSGPWLEPTPWPATWWNLNVQLEYWMIHGSNHLELDAITRSLDENRQRLIDGVPERYRHDSAGVARTTDAWLDAGAPVLNSAYPVGVPGDETYPPEVGSLTWALHNVWLSYRHTMDRSILRDVLFPLLRRAINYYRHFLVTGADGRLHLPLTYSPEYGNAPDCNYDLSLIRWGCRTLLDSAELLRIDDPLAPAWRDILAKLVDYPVDANGFMIGAGVPFAKSHRHYSHLLMVYPLYDVTWEQPQHRAVIEKSLDHWVSFEGALQGYTFTGAASMSAQMLKGDQADHYLGELLRRFVQPNTMYRESGPVIETPLSGAQSIHDMLCQSWGGVIRMFPAVPNTWADAVVQNFRTQGAFLVTAARRRGVTDFVRVYSEAGAPLRLRTGIVGPVEVRGRGVRHRVLPNGDLDIHLRRGAEVLVHARGAKPDLSVGPVPISKPAPPWGLP